MKAWPSGSVGRAALYRGISWPDWWAGGSERLHLQRRYARGLLAAGCGGQIGSKIVLRPPMIFAACGVAPGAGSDRLRS
ncbi:hypothetical protein NDU88_007191 [Pleurodeles waltl]|uniref:Uncharacterized protein n=1 Tax=Pleurodeles waltl TaxID=8319 RepID=A0AAV7UNN8_PLEWA|nr:hypothetical protein NDU88_007191 [Pleurodeles waltl]